MEASGAYIVFSWWAGGIGRRLRGPRPEVRNRAEQEATGKRKRVQQEATLRSAISLVLKESSQRVKGVVLKEANSRCDQCGAQRVKGKGAAQVK